MLRDNVLLFLWEIVKSLSLGLLRTALTDSCQVDLILPWDRREVPRVPAITIFYDSVITRFTASVGLVIQSVFEIELLGNLIT